MLEDQTTQERSTHDRTPAKDRRAVTLRVRSGERYRLGGALAQGGMGEILGAVDEQIGREVAVKRMKERHPTYRALGRFFREACIQGRLDHPAIVPVHELGVDEDGRPFFSMKKLAGTTLAERMAAGESRQRLLRAFADVCLAVEFAHARGVVHRDLKPHNIVLGDFGEVYVLDWGIAKLIGEADVGGDGEEITGPETRDGAMIGTPGYMPPEQIQSARDVDGRADVYALGCVLFEILTGEPLHPRGDAGLASALAGIDARPSLRVPTRDIPPELDGLCVAATAADRDARMRSPRQLGEGVQRYLDGDRDLALRQQLARVHLESARAKFAAGDPAAMREAGRALALDPTLSGAAELVSRLMLEPPRVRPRELQSLIEAENLETVRRQAHAGVCGYLGFLAFVPALLANGTRNLGYVAILLTLIGLNIVTLAMPYENAHRVWRAVRVAVCNGMLVAFLGHILSPFLVAPGVAALATMAVVFSPTYDRLRGPVLVAGIFIAAILVPWLAEVVGLLPSTMQFAGDYFIIGPTPLPVLAPGMVMYAVALIVTAAGISYANRRTERDVRERLHLQAWQLRQLVG